MTQRVLETGCGPMGVEDDGTRIRAHGIGYAVAERFGAPRPVAARRDIHDGTVRGPVCPQLPSRLNFVTGPVVEDLRQDEACQVLTVTAPSGAQNLPVMVWFHGGAYMSGGGEAAKYDADDLVADGQVIVVSVTYRLGIFGYLNPDADGAANIGLQDQISALRWIQQHIASFGGDPQQVTIFGQSAGGDSVLALILADGTDGLFRRAILQSAPLALRHGRDEMTTAMRAAIRSALAGVAPSDAGVDQLLRAQIAAVQAARRFGVLGALPFAPLSGRAPLPSEDAAADRLAQRAGEIDIMVGYTRNDADPFIAMDPRAQRLRRFGRAGKLLTQLTADRATERVFGAPARQFAQSWRTNGGAAVSYRVDWRPPGAPLRACHCIELPLLFSPDRWAGAPMLGTVPHPVDLELARQVRRYWTVFAHSGTAGIGEAHLNLG